eukprot:1258789-Rhodomonas_salina.1
MLSTPGLLLFDSITPQPSLRTARRSPQYKNSARETKQMTCVIVHVVLTEKDTGSGAGLGVEDGESQRSSGAGTASNKGMFSQACPPLS